MKAKRIFEGYGPYLSYGNRNNCNSMIGRTNTRRSNYSPYTYKVMHFNHTLEQPISTKKGIEYITKGAVVAGKRFTNFNDDKTYQGIITKIQKSNEGVIEKVGISNKGKIIWLDPITLSEIDNNYNVSNMTLYTIDDSMEFK